MKVEQLKMHKLPSAVLGAAVSVDAKEIYAACMDGGVYRVDAGTGASSLLVRHESFASGAHLLPEQSQLISAGYDGVLQWVDLASGQLVRRVAAHQFWSWQSDLSPDRKRIASVTGQYLAGGIKYEPAAEREPCVKVFDTASGQLICQFSHVPSVQAVAWSPDNRHLAAANLMGEIRVYDVAAGTQVAAWTSSAFTSWGTIKSHCYQGGIYALAFTGDGEHVLAAGMGPMRDPMSGNGKTTWQRFAWRKESAPKIDEIHDGDHGNGHPEALAFHPAGKCFVMAGRLAQGKWNAGFFDAGTGNLVHALDTKCRLSKACFTPDGGRLVLGGSTGQPKRDAKDQSFGRVFVLSVEA